MINIKEILLIACIGLAIISCKKEDEEYNDPDFIERTLNISITDTLTMLDNEISKQIDIDGNSIADFLISARFVQAGGADTVARLLKITGTTANNKSGANNTPTIYGTAYITRGIAAEGVISSTYPFFNQESHPYIALYKGASRIQTFGSITDDAIVGITLVKGASIHYGWLRYKISADGKTLTIIDAAYNNIPSEAIGAGKI